MDVELRTHREEHRRLPTLVECLDEVRKRCVREAVTVRGQEGVVADMRRYGLQPLTDRGVDPGVDEGDPPLVELAREELELRTVRAAVEHEVVEHRPVVREEVVLDDFALVPQAQNELVVTPHRVVAHDVPEDRLAADLDHRLGDALRLLAHAHTEATAEDHHFHLATPESVTVTSPTS